MGCFYDFFVRWSVSRVEARLFLAKKVLFLDYNL